MPERSFSKSEIDRLGVRLKRGAPTDADLTVLDAYRGTFAAAYAFVVTALRRRLRVKATGRPAKSTTSVIDKLQRETIRLSQMQDIAGCRIVVRNIVTQNKLLARIQALFPGCTTVDRREHPSHPYRAVHVIRCSILSRLAGCSCAHDRLLESNSHRVGYDGAPRMIFLIEYDRRRRHIVTFERYDDAQRVAADARRLELELSRGRYDPNRELVLLQATDEAALRQTHRRYFETAREIIESST